MQKEHVKTRVINRAETPEAERSVSVLLQHRQLFWLLTMYRYEAGTGSQEVEALG